MKKYETLKRICQTGVVAVVRSKTEALATRVSTACMNGGIDIIEITFSVPGADQVIRNLKTEFSKEEILVGAGTVLDVTTARIAILAGADFIVGPTFEKEVALLCNYYHIPYIPGCMTVNECAEALKYGVDVIKLFPGDQFTPGFIKSVKAPLPQVNFMVTGGVNIQNTAEWIKAGAVAIGVGGNLTNVQGEDYTTVEEVAADYIKQVKVGREQ